MSTPIRTGSASTGPESDHRRRPRKKRIPCGRDQAILIAYRTTGCSQADLAEEYHLSQSRIGQIIRRVDAWRSEASPSESSQALLQRQRLERSMQEQRLQAIYDRGLKGYDQAPRELTTLRQGERDGKPFKEETRRQQPAPVQLLKAALGASRELDRLADKPLVDESTPQDAEERRELAVRILSELRDQAQEAGRVTSRGDEEAVVRDVVRSLVGEPNAGFWKFLQDDAEEKEAEKRKSSATAHASFSNSSNLSNPAADELTQGTAGTELIEPQQPDKYGFSTDYPVGVAWAPPSTTGVPLSARQTLGARQSAVGTPRPTTQPPHEPPDVPKAHRMIPRTVFHNGYETNDYGWQPSPPPSAEERRAMLEEYLAQRRAQNEANLRQWAAADAEDAAQRARAAPSK